MGTQIIINENIILVKAEVKPKSPTLIRVVVNTSKDSIAVNELKEDLGELTVDLLALYQIAKI